MLVDERQFRPYMSPAEVRETIANLAAQINRDHTVDDKVLLVGVLKGAIIVIADLVRLLHSDVRVDFVRTVSVGKSQASAGTVCLLKDINDSGRALKFLYDRLKAANPLSLKVATMMDKREKRMVDVRVD